jgi:hypothetical protein
MPLTKLHKFIIKYVLLEAKKALEKEILSRSIF